MIRPLLGCQGNDLKFVGNPGEAEHDSAMKLNRIPGGF